MCREWYRLAGCGYAEHALLERTEICGLATHHDQHIFWVSKFVNAETCPCIYGGDPYRNTPHPDENSLGSLQNQGTAKWQATQMVLDEESRDGGGLLHVFMESISDSVYDQDGLDAEITLPKDFSWLIDLDDTSQTRGTERGKSGIENRKRSFDQITDHDTPCLGLDLTDASNRSSETTTQAKRKIRRIESMGALKTSTNSVFIHPQPQSSIAYDVPGHSRVS
jgi:hypothetical protein